MNAAKPNQHPTSCQKKTVRKIAALLVCSSIVLPATVYAALQPLETQFPLPEIEQQDPPENFRDTLYRLPPLINTSRGVYENISNGNVEAAIYGVIGILGQLGLINPASQSAQAGDPGASANSTNDPYSNPETPEAVYNRQRYQDIVRAAYPQTLSQIVFGFEGQEEMAQENAATMVAQQASQSAHEVIQSISQASAATSQENIIHADTVYQKAEEAVDSSASQDVLKALAEQNADLSKISSNSSLQLAQLTDVARHQSAQLSASNAMLSALNNKAQTLEIFGASENYLLAQLDSSLDHSLDYQQAQDSLRQKTAHQASSLIFIPGLVSAPPQP